MKGAVFIALNEMIEEQYGLKTWLDLVEAAGVDGIYTATDNYPDEEVFAIVGAVCEKLNAEPAAVLRAFGEYLFHFLHKSHPAFAEQQPSFFDFIQSIDGVIHAEVHKLDESALTPKIDVRQLDDNHAELAYSSPRKLCFLAEGLLKGSAAYYGIQISIHQTQCMHDDHDECLLQIQQENA